MGNWGIGGMGWWVRRGLVGIGVGERVGWDGFEGERRKGKGGWGGGDCVLG